MRVFCLCLILLGTGLAAGPRPVLAADVQEHILPEKKVQGVTVIHLHRHLQIDQPDITISPGSTVVWLNGTEGLIEIQFPEKLVRIACDRPVNFILDPAGTFVSNKIPVGGVAGICFIEKGTYAYEVTRVSRAVATAQKGRGRITVR